MKKGIIKTKVKRVKRVRTESTSTSSTRSIILKSALELINNGGLMDFKIDNLAEHVKLSSGNITYHFSRKEEICAVLWNDFLAKIDTYDVFLTKLLDLRQAFVMVRSMCQLTYDYRGVIMFRGSDVRIMNEDDEIGQPFMSHSREIFGRMIELFQRNGFISGSDDKTTHREIEIETILVRWWLNMTVMIKQSIDAEVLRDSINHNALLILFALYGDMTDKGRAQFDELITAVEKKEI